MEIEVFKYVIEMIRTSTNGYVILGIVLLASIYLVFKGDNAEKILRFFPSQKMMQQADEVASESIAIETLSEEKEKALWQAFNNHDFFYFMRGAMALDIEHIEISNPVKKYYLQKVLRILFEATLDNFQEHIRHDDLVSLSISEHKKRFQHLLLTSIAVAKNRWRENHIPEIVIEKFGIWHADTLKNTLRTVERLFERTDIESSTLQCFNNALVATMMSYQFTITDAKRTLESLNGQLDNLRYSAESPSSNLRL